MKIVIASDIHGSYTTIKEIDKIIKKERAEKLILLGDIYNHGPRNPLPDDYRPMMVAEYLNSLSDKLIVIKGNCDSEVDKMISDFAFAESTYLIINNISVFLTHGHVYNENDIPKNCRIMFYGHFHTAFIKRKEDVLLANPGSISLPKDNKKCYLLIDDEMLYLKDINGNIVEQTALNN